MATLWTRQPRSATANGRTAGEAASEVGRRPRARGRDRESVRRRRRRRRVKLLSVRPSLRPQTQRLRQRRAQYERSARQSGSDFGARLRERSRATRNLCRGTLYGRPRTADGEKVGLAIQLNRKGRKEDCGGTRRRRERVRSVETPLAVQTLVVSGSRNNGGRRRRRGPPFPVKVEATNRCQLMRWRARRKKKRRRRTESRKVRGGRLETRDCSAEIGVGAASAALLGTKEERKEALNR